MGTAIEYPPWGLVEKTAGVAIKGGFRAAGVVSARVSTSVGEKLFGKYVPPPVPASVAKFTQYAKEVILPARKAFGKEIPKLRARQREGIKEVYESYRRGEIEFKDIQQKVNAAQKGALSPEFELSAKALAARQEKAIADVNTRVIKGELSEASGKALITKIRKNPAFVAVPFEQAEVKELHDMIVNAVADDFVTKDSAEAFLDLMLLNKIPEPRFLRRDWVNVFGADFAKSVGRLRGMPQNKVDQFLDTLNIGRSLQASFDLSGTLRQGLILSLLHPTQVPKWFGRQVRALFSEKWAREIDDTMRLDSQFREVMVALKYYLAPLEGATVHTGEELFASSFARRIPGIRRSERAFLTYLNQARYTSAKTAYNTMKAQGATAEEFELMGKFIDFASGRGAIPKSLEKFSPVLNAMLTHPRPM